MNEFFGAIQRVNDEKAVGSNAMAIGLFLGNDFDVGEGCAQTGEYQGIGGLVGGGYGAVVGFQLHVKIVALVNAHDLGAS